MKQKSHDYKSTFYTILFFLCKIKNSMNISSLLERLFDKYKIYEDYYINLNLGHLLYKIENRMPFISLA